MRTLITSAIMLALSTGGAFAGTTMDYEVDGATYEGYMATPDGDSNGLVLVIHDWDGLDGYEMRRADMLAELGYTAFAVDLYGKGNRPDTTEGKKAEVGKLYSDREAMRSRIMGGLGTARAASGEERAVVMGYCFGGAATLELARSRAAENLAGFATFHGGLSTPEGQGYSGVTEPLLIMHGGADAGIPMTDVAALSVALEEAGTPYEIEVYSGAPHAWTVFDSPRYREEADRKSWEAFTGFLEEKL